MNNTKPKAATPFSEESHDGRGCCESKHATSPNESRMGGATVGHLSCKPCFLFADVTLFHLCLRLRCSAKLGNPAASNSFDEFFLLQPGECLALFTKQANKQVRHRN